MVNPPKERPVRDERDEMIDRDSKKLVAGAHDMRNADFDGYMRGQGQQRLEGQPVPPVFRLSSGINIQIQHVQGKTVSSDW